MISQIKAAAKDGASDWIEGLENSAAEVGNVLVEAANWLGGLLKTVGEGALSAAGALGDGASDVAEGTGKFAVGALKVAGNILAARL